MKRAERLFVGMVLGLHALLLAYAASTHNPTVDEAAHLAAGLSHWRFGNFNLYRVNPPLVRLLVTAPVLFTEHRTQWRAVRMLNRPEFDLGREFVLANGRRSVRLCMLARWAAIPFALAGAYACCRWACCLYGGRAGLFALLLWCFSPTMIAYGHLIVPDVAAASAGIISGGCFWAWLRKPNWPRALTAGVCLGLAMGTKTTWVVLVPLWPALWLAYCRSPQRRSPSVPLALQGRQMGTILGAGLLVLNAAYGFEKTLRPLGDFDFVSKALTGHDRLTVPPRTGNRFRGTLLGSIPVPVPANYLLGIDEQKFDFEYGYWSYLRGRWREYGWWYYYLYAMAVKEPLGVLALAGLAAYRWRVRVNAGSWRDELVLLAPALVVVVVVSSQTGMNHHLRYVLPAYPFWFVWIARLSAPPSGGERALPAPGFKGLARWLCAPALAWFVASSLWAYPHSLAYFNESIGGPLNGHFHLLNSNADWGQDLLYLRRWLDARPEVRLDGLSYSFANTVPPEAFDLPANALPPDPRCPRRQPFSPSEFGPRPGWYAVSVSLLHDRNGIVRYLDRFKPVGRAGYSILIYHITPEEANRVRGQLGLPLLPADGQQQK